MITIKDNKFGYFMPMTLEKAQKGAAKSEFKMIVGGCMSTSEEDSDGQFLEPSGADFGPLLKSGFINWHHLAKDPDAIIGLPLEAYVKGNQAFIKALLHSDSELAKKVYNLQMRLMKAGGQRTLGWSLEGDVLEKDPSNPKRITKYTVTHVAITPIPKNGGTYMEILQKGGESNELLQLSDSLYCEISDKDIIYKDTNTMSFEKAVVTLHQAALEGLLSEAQILIIEAQLREGKFKNFQ